MTKSRYNPKYKLKLQNQIPKDIKSTNLLQNLQSFKDKNIIRKRFCFL